MYRTFTHLFVLILLLSCCSCREEVQLTMSEDKIIDILIDIQIAESASQGLRKNIKDSIITNYYAQIYEMHKVDKSIVDQNIEIIQSSAKLSEKIYEKVMTKLNNTVTDEVEVKKKSKEEILEEEKRLIEMEKIQMEKDKAEWEAIKKNRKLKKNK